MKRKRPRNAVVVWLSPECLAEIFNTEKHTPLNYRHACVECQLAEFHTRLVRVRIRRSWLETDSTNQQITLQSVFVPFFMPLRLNSWPFVVRLCVFVCECMGSASASLCLHAQTLLFSTSEPSTMHLNRVMNVSFLCQA